MFVKTMAEAEQISSEIAAKEMISYTLVFDQVRRRFARGVWSALGSYQSSLDISFGPNSEC